MNRFWFEADKWPRDHSGKTFLARAVLAVGTHLFAEWSGVEPAASGRPILALWDKIGEFKLLKQPNQLPAEQVAMVVALLRKEKPDLARTLPSPGLLEAGETFRNIHQIPSLQKPPTVPLEIWKLGAELAEKRNAAREADIARFEHVQAWLRNRLADGGLVSFVRPVPGGDFSPVPSSAWNTEALSPRFSLCQMNPADPFGHAISSPRHQFVFLGQSELNKALANDQHQIDRQTGKRSRAAFAAFVKELMLGSPGKRTMPKDAVVRIGVERHGLSGRDAEQVRKQVLDSGEIPEAVKSVWLKAGTDKRSA